ncbi:MAG: hypothetical protein AAF845_04560 [Bacteroidota bacterium]
MSDVTSFAQPLRIVWAAVIAGAAMVVAVMGWLATETEAHALAEHAEVGFYAVALLSAATIAGAFALIRVMEGKLMAAESDAQAEGLIRTFGIASLALAEVGAFAGAIAAFLTGDLLALAFAATFFGFAFLVWPSDDRVGGWLALRRL